MSVREPVAGIAPLPVNPAQLAFLARETAFDIIGNLEPFDSDTSETLFDLIEAGWSDADLVSEHGFSQRELAAYWQAVEDLAKARLVMEEAAAFTQLTRELELKFPDRSRQENQKAARVLAADEGTRTRAAAASGLWAKINEVRKNDV